MSDLDQWYVSEYEWHSPGSDQYDHLMRNIEWLSTHGAHVIEESVNGFEPQVFLRRHGLTPNDVSTVVWGSPCTDMASGGYSKVPESILSQAEREEHRNNGRLDSSTIKSAIFRHLQQKFPYALVIVTCVWCSPTAAEGKVDASLLSRVLLCGEAWVPEVDGVQYAPSFASGVSRVDKNSAEDISHIKVLAAVPKEVVSRLGGRLFTSEGKVDLYRLIGGSAKFNGYVNDEGRKVGVQLYLGEENADLSRCAAQYNLKHLRRKGSISRSSSPSAKIPKPSPRGSPTP
jgi:hypothetical protein